MTNNILCYLKMSTQQNRETMITGPTHAIMAQSPVVIELQKTAFKFSLQSGFSVFLFLRSSG